jgi:putative ABC transport system permease protein
MPADFVFPYPGMLGPSGFTRETSVDMWVPMAFSGPMATVQRVVDQSGQIPRGVHWLGAIGRMRPGVTAEQVQTDLGGVAQQLAQTFPQTNQGWGVTVVSAREQTIGTIRPALLVLLAGVGLVLLMSAVNVANLVFARSLAREKEQATRVALGASRARLVQHSIVESLLLALAGGVVGLAVMAWGVRLFVQLAPADLPRVAEISTDWRVVGATFALSLFTGAIVGLLPAFRAASVLPQSALQEHARGATAGRSHQRYRAGLLVAEVAFAVVLTMGAGLLLRSFVSLMNVKPGFDAAHLLTWQINLPERLRTADERRLFYRDLFGRLEQLPGVISVGGTTRLPLGSTSVSTSVEIEGRPTPPAGLPEVEFRRSLHRYFDAMSIPLVRGRGFTADDGPDTTPVAVINQTMARRLFPGEDPIGRHLRTGPAATGPWLEIVGVIGDVRHTGLEQLPAPEMYVSYLQNPPIAPFIVMRAEGDPAALADRVRAEARALDKDLPLFDLRTMTEVRSESVAQRRFIVLLVGAFGLLALILAAVGIDGVMAVAVGERTQEMGVRLALGARPSQLLSMLMLEAARLTTVGIVVGLALTAATMPMIRTQLFGVELTDPLIVAGVPIVLMTIAMMAAVLPALRAARVDPVQVLRKA